jgi:hypothetical protein
MTDFYITTAEKKGDLKKVYGPYSSYIEAHEIGARFGREGLITEVHRADIVCDFCSTPEVKWMYPADDIAVDALQWGSRGEWAACDTCHALIESSERDKLAEHSLSNFIKFNPEMPVASDSEMRREIAKGIRALHEAFFLARIGKAERTP